MEWNGMTIRDTDRGMDVLGVEGMKVERDWVTMQALVWQGVGANPEGTDKICNTILYFD